MADWASEEYEDKIVTFNLRGEKLQTRARHLLKYDSELRTKVMDMINEERQGIILTSGIFIDMERCHFNIILNFLRGDGFIKRGEHTNATLKLVWRHAYDLGLGLEMFDIIFDYKK